MLKSEARETAILDHIELTSQERQQIEQAMREVPPDFRSRLAFRDAVIEMVRDVAPEHEAAARRFNARFPAGLPFSWGPMSDVALPYYHAGRLTWPAKPIEEGCASFIDAAFDRLAQLPVLQPLFRSCEGSPQEFFDAVTQTGHGLSFSGGKAHHHREGKTSSVIRYEAYPVRILRPLFIGFYAGVLRHLTGSSQAVGFEVINPRTGELSLAW